MHIHVMYVPMDTEEMVSNVKEITELHFKPNSTLPLLLLQIQSWLIFKKHIVLQLVYHNPRLLLLALCQDQLLYQVQ